MAMACRALVTLKYVKCVSFHACVVASAACSLQRHLWVWCDTCTHRRNGAFMSTYVLLLPPYFNTTNDKIVEGEMHWRESMPPPQTSYFLQAIVDPTSHTKYLKVLKEKYGHDLFTDIP